MMQTNRGTHNKMVVGAFNKAERRKKRRDANKPKATQERWVIGASTGGDWKKQEESK